MRILFQKQTPKVVCHKCPNPTAVTNTTSNEFCQERWGPKEGDCSYQLMSPSRAEVSRYFAIHLKSKHYMLNNQSKLQAWW